jgi:hypothetical protein
MASRHNRLACRDIVNSNLIAGGILLTAFIATI